jgi:hypothetical protein
MLEPDPDLRAPSIGDALDVAAGSVASVASVTRSSPSSAPAAPLARAGRSSEDAAVKSIGGLLWALWGLGWILVPMVFGKILGVAVAIPIVMFGWMALNLIVTWHKGAVVRALVRAWNAEKAQPSQVRQRVQVDEVQHQVRVNATGLGPEEVVAGTEVQSSEQGARRHAPK